MEVWKQNLTIFHFLPAMANGYVTFVISLVFIGACTAVIGDVAAHLGCFINLKDGVNAIAFVALGTSVPGTKMVSLGFSFFATSDLYRILYLLYGIFWECHTIYSYHILYLLYRIFWESILTVYFIFYIVYLRTSSYPDSVSEKNIEVEN